MNWVRKSDEVIITLMKQGFPPMSGGRELEVAFGGGVELGTVEDDAGQSGVKADFLAKERSHPVVQGFQ